MDRFRAAINELVDKVKETINGEPKHPVEVLLDLHLSLDEDFISFSPKNCMAVAVPTAVMNDFAARTRNVVDYPFIMERIWEILIDHQHDPTLMKKALNLLLYLLINGAIQVLKDCQDSARVCFLQNLSEDYNRYEFEQYKFSQHLDVGAGVRKTAAEVLHLISNERELLHARREAERMHHKLSDRGLRAMSSSALHFQPNEGFRPPPYTDFSCRESTFDDVSLKIVTHPDDLFDDPLPNEIGARAASPTTIQHVNALKDVEVRTVHSYQSPLECGINYRKNYSGSFGEDGDNGPTKSKTTTDSVDLLGLEALGLDSLSPTSSRPKSLASSSNRTQSAQFRASEHLTATI